MPNRFRLTIAWIGLLAASTAVAAVKIPESPATAMTELPRDLDGFCTGETAVTTRLRPATQPASQVGYLGIAFAPNADGKLLIEDVNPASPASLAGFKMGDVVVKAGADQLTRAASLQEYLLGRAPGETVTLTIVRDGKTATLSATLAPTSRPMKPGTRRVVMGVQLRDAAQGEGATIDRVTPGMPADRAGLQIGDVVVECDSIPITARQALGDALFGRNPGENVKLMVKRGGKLEEVHVTLAPDPTPPEDSRPGDRATIFRKPVYRLAIIGVEFPDVKHNDKIAIKNWEESFFSIGAYKTTSATSQPVFGSVNDYYHEDSAGAFRIEGKMFDWIAVAKNRTDYSQGTGDPLKMRAEALDILLKREGNDALQAFDGVAFIYAGTRVPTSRGGLFWPHKGTLQYGRRRLNYLIVNEGGQKMTDISVFCHEFGHMLGLPDLYARPENPGSEGLGAWCLMSNQLPNGRPQHMSAWCKEQLGWLKPAIIDPTVPQKLVLSPVEGSSDQCFKVLVRSDGSEYFLLENRHKTGFDTDLPGDGLLIWRVVEGRPFLQESHGIEGPAGPRSFLWEVPFPSISNSSFTPFTTPSSHSLLGGGMPVFITGIDRLPDGRVTFAIGYQYF